jgi:RNA polymerase sigma-70 factor (ECF subfamily)
MHSTPVSLLERLRDPGETAAWDRFVALYTPLLYHWARRLDLQESDAGDLVQEVYLTLVQELPQFNYQPGKRFRGWLWTVLVNRWRQRRRQREARPVEAGDDALDNYPAPDSAAPLEEEEYRQYLVGRALQLMQADFQPATWKACWEYVVAGRPVEEVAAELGITTNAVHLARARVLRRLRQELEGLLE